MLRITPDAIELIVTLTAAVNVPTGGLRVDVHPVGSLLLSLAAKPRPDDEIVLVGDARVYLSPDAGTRLSSRTLHATGTPDDRRFHVLP